jgi:mRNA interferase RelE/StbE
MEFKFKKSFEHDFRKVKDKNLAKSILECVQKVSEAQSINDINNLKKISGHKSAYRIRTGNYRIGIMIENNIAIFVAFAHRKEIYRKFPLL